MRHYPEEWKRVRRRCAGCSGLLGELVHGWGLPSEDSREGDRWRTERKRWRFLRKRQRRPKRSRYTVEEDGEERPLKVGDDREVWAKAGVPEYALDEMFPETERGRPRLHRWLTPEVADDLLTRLQRSLSHLYDVPTADLEAHFTESFGEPWPPHLEQVHDVLLNDWTRGDRDLSASEREARKGRATARRVAMVLPIEVDVSCRPPEATGEVPGWRKRLQDVTYRPCPLTYEQIRGLDRN